LTIPVDVMDFEISPEFFVQEKCNAKRGGPYKKQEQAKRQDEVYRLHFELGYSANKISEMMHVNRKTINSDIGRLRDRLHSQMHEIDLDSLIMRQLNRIEMQRQRLVAEINSGKSLSEKIPIEKIVFEVDCKMLAFLIKMKWGENYVFEETVKKLNTYSREKNQDISWVAQGDIIGATHQTIQKIRKLVREDKRSQNF
jgi:predicted DNA-binding protein YlxM (UPF0122 family)